MQNLCHAEATDYPLLRAPVRRAIGCLSDHARLLRGRPQSASIFCDRFPYIARYARETIAESASMGVALVTGDISPTGPLANRSCVDLESIRSTIRAYTARRKGPADLQRGRLMACRHAQPQRLKSRAEQGCSPRVSCQRPAHSFAPNPALCVDVAYERGGLCSPGM